MLSQLVFLLHHDSILHVVKVNRVANCSGRLNQNFKGKHLAFKSRSRDPDPPAQSQKLFKKTQEKKYNDLILYIGALHSSSKNI